MKLGIIAGNGALPGLLANHCLSNGIKCHAFVIEQQDMIALPASLPQYRFRLGAIGRLVRLLKEAGITDAVFIGGIRKPGLLALRPDLFTLRQLPGLGLFSSGDDGLLKRIVKRFEDRLGIRVRGIHEFMPELLAPAGRIGTHQPTSQHWQAIERGVNSAHRHGLKDKGQAVIADSMHVIDVERRDGTRALLSRVHDKPGAVLVKLAKPQQDLRLDMPTIGVDTIRQASAAGLVGVAVSAGKTLVIDRITTAAVADAAGLFLIGLDS